MVMVWTLNGVSNLFDGFSVVKELTYQFVCLEVSFHRHANLIPRRLAASRPVLVIGAILGREARHAVLRLGLRGRWRRRFAALLQRIVALTISTVAQFADYAKNPALRPWKPRRPAHQHPLVLMPN